MTTLPPDTNPPVHIAGVILIGGRSRRMGQEKALLKLGETTFLGFLVDQLRQNRTHHDTDPQEWHGTPACSQAESQIENTCRAPTPACDPIFVVGRPDQSGLTPPGCTFVVDAIPDRGPLAGLMSGLNAAAEIREYAVVLSVDTPLFPVAVLNFLTRRLGSADAAIPWDGQRLYGLSALYRTDVANQIGAMLDAGQSRIQDLPESIDVARIDLDEIKQVDPQLFSIAGANTPEEYSRLVAFFP